MILGLKPAFLILLPYLLNHFDFSSHILTPGRSWAELVTLGGVVDFRVGAPFLEQKTTFLVTNLYANFRALLALRGHILTN